MECEHYQNYYGPKLTKATLNDEDITNKIKEVYSDNHNWKGKLWKYKEVFGNNCNNKNYYCEFHSEDGRKHWFYGFIKDINQFFNPPLHTPISQKF